MVATSAVSAKGVDKLGKVAKAGKIGEAASKARTVTKTTLAKHAESANNKLNKWSTPLFPRTQFANAPIPYNIIDTKELRNKLQQLPDHDDRLTNQIDHVRDLIQQASAKVALAKVTGKDYKNYKANKYIGTTKVNGEVRNISRKVFQRLDIDYERIDPDTGLTNLQLMKKGRTPFWKDGTAIELHHLIQREPGSMVEIPASMHDEYNKILHGLVEHGRSFRNDPVLKKQYDNFRSKYWRWRAKQIEKK